MGVVIIESEAGFRPSVRDDAALFRVIWAINSSLKLSE